MPSYSFSKNRRLLKASEYQEVFDRNKLKVAHPKLLLLAKQSDCDQSRLGLVVGKKNIPTAVGRNRVKRLVRETFRQAQFPTALDIIFLARKDADKLSKTELNLLLKQSWCRLRQRCEGLDNNNG
ncbi:ribonuclease P protein component [Porticoccaceae bacterium]|nr:ribonuclease P protein component [Porticoccaceae bacterium]